MISLDEVCLELANATVPPVPERDRDLPCSIMYWQELEVKRAAQVNNLASMFRARLQWYWYAR